MGNDECSKLEIELERLLQQGHRRVIIDFVALTFITSASLLRLAQQTRRFQREEGELKIEGFPPFAARLTRFARLERALKPAVGLAAAIQSLPVIETSAPKQNGFRLKEKFIRESNHTQTSAVEPS